MNEEVDDFVRFLKKIYRIFWKWVYFIFKGNFIFKLKKNLFKWDFGGFYVINFLYDFVVIM